VTAAIAAFLLVACGGDSNKAGDPDPSAEADFVVDSFGDLSICNNKREGATAYVKDEEKDYICTDGDWTIDTNADTRKKSSSSKDKVKSSSSESVDEYDGEVEEFGDLSKCSEKMDGKVYYVEDEDITYTCSYDEDEEAGEWVSKKKKSVDDDDQESSSSVNETDDSSSSEELDDDSSSSGESEDESSSSSSISPFSSDGSIYDATANTLTDLRDGQVYRTTTIDIPAKSYSEVWMAENLNLVTENSWCGGGHDYKDGDCSVYGRLYTWAAAVAKPEDECGYGYKCGLGTGNIRGACPKGWHVPSQSEQNDLFTAVGGSDVAGKVLKSETGWRSYSGIENSDTYLFSALPAGLRDDDGGYRFEGSDAYFWSSTEYGSGGAYYKHLTYGYDYAYLSYDYKDYGFSVRCIQD
jgi:uncharacterized protein (TIGR02145 family)